MNSSLASVEEVAAFLSNAGYRRLPLPLTVASVPFEFGAAFVGTERSSDLVVVLDTIHETEPFVLRRKLEGLSRALDVAGSKRPLTAILVGPRPLMATLEIITQFCRVLVVSRPLNPRAGWVADALAVLLPLKLPQAEQTTSDPMTDLSARLAETIDRSVVSRLISATRTGIESVEKELRDLLQEPFKFDDEMNRKQ